MTDLLILGAGPAGCAAAITAARAGALRHHPGAGTHWSARPGETLNVGAEALFSSLGVRSAIDSARPLRFDRIQQVGTRQPFLPWEGVHVPRAVLDAILLACAQESGARVFYEQGEQLVVEGGRVSGVATRSACHRARFVIDATGSRHFIGRRLGLGFFQESRRRFVNWGHVRGVPACVENEPMFRVDGDGWLWIARVEADTTAWVHTPAGGRRATRAIPAEASHLPSLSPGRTADVTWRLVKSCAGPGFFIAGDAASVVDPASSHGILKALMAGQLAASLVHMVPSGQMLEDEATREHDRWCAQWFAHDCRNLNRFYRDLNPAARAAYELPHFHRTSGETQCLISQLA